MKEWTCEYCGGKTGSDSVCVRCKNEETEVQGTASRSYIKFKEVGKMDEKKMCEALEKALRLEEEGMNFYTKCGETTNDKNGREMFQYLAKEEVKHYNKVAQIFKTYLQKGYCDYIAGKKDAKKSGVFEKNFPGGSLNEKSDVLDALNIGLKAEENSIRLYKKLATGAESDDVRLAFQKMMDEEQRHKSILENEVEYVTGTGEFNDFRQVTS